MYHRDHLDDGEMGASAPILFFIGQNLTPSITDEQEPTMKNATATKFKPITTAAPLYGRCIQLAIGGAVVEVKVMGDREVAAAQRELGPSAPREPPGKQ